MIVEWGLGFEINLRHLILQKAMKENNIDLNEVDREVLGTVHEKTKTSSDEA